MLQRFLMRQQMWNRLGLRADDLERLPEREFQDYCTIIALLTREESARRLSGGDGR